MAGLGFGGGVQAEITREATLPACVKLPGYVRLDAAAWQRFTVRGRPLRAQVNVQNITDARILDTDGAATLRLPPPWLDSLVQRLPTVIPEIEMVRHHADAALLAPEHEALSGPAGPRPRAGGW